MKCEETKINGCRATGYISRDENNVFTLRRLHNHPVRPSRIDLRELRNVLGDQCVQQTARSFSARNLYMEAIVRLIFCLQRRMV